MLRLQENATERRFARRQTVLPALIIVSLSYLLLACATQPTSPLVDDEGIGETADSAAVTTSAATEVASVRSPSAESADPDLDEYVARGQSLVLAARFGHKAALLNQGADLEQRDEQGYTPLIAAAGEPSGEILDLLIEQGADVDARTNDGTSALMLAAARGYLDHVRRLLEAGADLALQDDEGLDALQTAIRFGHPQIVDFLLAAGAEVNPYSQEIVIEEDRQTPLMLAVRYGAARDDGAAIVRALLAAGAEPNLVRANGDTALTIARRLRSRTIIDVLQRHGGRDESPYALMTHEEALLRAIDRNDLKKVSELLADATDANYRDSLSGITPLLKASYRGRLAIVKQLVEHGADIDDVPWGLPELRIGYVNIATSDRPLARTATRGDTPLITAIRQRHSDVATFLIEQGAHPALPNRINETPGLLAARFGDVAVMRGLLTAGLDPDLKRIPAIDGYSIANIVRRERIRPMLIEAAIAGHADIIDALLGKGEGSADIRDEDGRTALSWAAAEGNLACVETLLTYEADPDISDAAQVTPLMLAARSGYLRIVEALVEHRANVNAIEGSRQEDRYRALDQRSGNTALILAARGGHLDIVRFLLAHGAMRGLRSSSGVDAAEIARRNGHLQVARLIEGDGGR